MTGARVIATRPCIGSPTDCEGCGTTLLHQFDAASTLALTLEASSDGKLPNMTIGLSMR